MRKAHRRRQQKSPEGIQAFLAIGGGGGDRTCRITLYISMLCVNAEKNGEINVQADALLAAGAEKWGFS